eukprot:SAG22_NODE_1040_length_5886_cov_3.559855_1_plen_21_part_10
MTPSGTVGLTLLEMTDNEEVA